MKVNMNIYFPCSPLPFMIILAEFCNFGYFSLPKTGKKQEYLSTGMGKEVRALAKILVLSILLSVWEELAESPLLVEEARFSSASLSSGSKL